MGCFTKWTLDLQLYSLTSNWKSLYIETTSHYDLKRKDWIYETIALSLACETTLLALAWVVHCNCGGRVRTRLVTDQWACKFTCVSSFVSFQLFVHSPEVKGDMHINHRLLVTWHQTLLFYMCESVCKTDSPCKANYSDVSGQCEIE